MASYSLEAATVQQFLFCNCNKSVLQRCNFSFSRSQGRETSSSNRRDFNLFQKQFQMLPYQLHHKSWLSFLKIYLYIILVVLLTRFPGLEFALQPCMNRETCKKVNEHNKDFVLN